MDEGGEGRGQPARGYPLASVCFNTTYTYVQTGMQLAAIMNWYLLLVISDLYPSRRLTYVDLFRPSSIQRRVEKSKTRRGGIN